MIDERERVQRAAAAAKRAAGGMSPEPEPADYRPNRRMPGSGQTLSGDVIEADDGSDDEDAAARDVDDDDE